MIAFNLGKEGVIIQKACERSAERVIIRLLRLKGYQNKAAIIAWIMAIIIHRPKTAVITPAINLSIFITSFLYHIHDCRPLLTKILAQLMLAVKCKTTQLARNTEVI